MDTRKVARAVILVAMAVALSPIFIPVGFVKLFPAQHMINVIGAVMLGPWYAVGVATAAAIIRNLMGVGTPLAFPGGMIGAMLAGIAYMASRNINLAAAGEIVGTGLLGAMVSVWIVAPLMMKKTMAASVLIVAFGLSSLTGAVLGVLALQVLRKAGIWQP
ncbi:MAG: energy coupling factor transporter S component ThiW [Thermodesulfobacteriota bacterium]